MDIPAPFQPVFNTLRDHGYELITHGWTSEKGRHYHARLTRGGKTYFCKMTQRQIDLDDPDRQAGMERALWFSEVVEAVRRDQPKLPFTTPPIVATNLFHSDASDVVWILMRHNDRGEICSDFTDVTRLCSAMADTHAALQRITPAYLAALGIADILPPYLPHETLGWRGTAYTLAMKFFPPLRRWLRRRLDDHEKRVRADILAHPHEWVLDHGAFERKNCFIPPLDSRAQLDLMDTEFAGWARHHHALAKAYVRLWANDQQPEVARTLLRTYVERHVPENQRNLFFRWFAYQLRGKITSGWFYDTFRRKHFSPWFHGHVLRRELKRILKRQAFDELM